MAYLDDLLTRLAEGNTEQILFYTPFLIIGLGILIMILIFIIRKLGNFSGFFAKLKEKFKSGKSKPVKSKTALKEKKKDYKKLVSNALKITDPTKAMDELLIIINQYFSQLFNLKNVFTYEELISKVEENVKNVKLKEFCEKLINIGFSDNEVSREELEDIAKNFIILTKKHPLHTGLRPRPKAYLNKLKIFRRFRRFRKELKAELSKKKTIKEKTDKVIEKTGKTIWDSVKQKLWHTKVPKQVSFDNVISDISKNKQKDLKTVLKEEEKPTLESFFYFIYLFIRKRWAEQRNIRRINDIIIKGKHELMKKGDIAKAQELYYSIIPIYNALAEHNKEKTLQKIVLFYEEINKVMILQRIRIYILQIKLLVKSKDYMKAKNLYSEVTKLYQQIPSDYKNAIYDSILEMEKDINASMTQKGGIKNAEDRS